MPPPTGTPIPDISAVVLAGGQARRLGGVDKGLIELRGRPLLDYILSALRPQVGSILINANRNLERYRAFGYPVSADLMTGYHGPLAGMATGLQETSSPWLLTVPCDSPFIAPHLAATLYRSLDEAGATLSVAHDGARLQPVYALLDRALLPDLLAYLGAGGRRIDAWYAHHRPALADFSTTPEMFLNLNTPADRAALEARLNG